MSPKRVLSRCKEAVETGDRAQAESSETILNAILAVVFDDALPLLCHGWSELPPAFSKDRIRTVVSNRRSRMPEPTRSSSFVDIAESRIFPQRAPYFAVIRLRCERCLWPTKQSRQYCEVFQPIWSLHIPERCFGTALGLPKDPIAFQEPRGSIAALFDSQAQAHARSVQDGQTISQTARGRARMTLYGDSTQARQSTWAHSTHDEMTSIGNPESCTAPHGRTIKQKREPRCDISIRRRQKSPKTGRRKPHMFHDKCIQSSHLPRSRSVNPP
jgi:hypothetical protein